MRRPCAASVAFLGAPTTHINIHDLRGGKSSSGRAQRSVIFEHKLLARNLHNWPHKEWGSKHAAPNDVQPQLQGAVIRRRLGWSSIIAAGDFLHHFFGGVPLRFFVLIEIGGGRLRLELLHLLFSRVQGHAVGFKIWNFY